MVAPAGSSEQGLTPGEAPLMMRYMQREIVEQILADRKIEPKNDRYPIPKDAVATVLLGGSKLTTVSGVVSLTLKPGYLLAESKKGSHSYFEYEVVRGLSFEPKDIADRHAGFM